MNWDEHTVEAAQRRIDAKRKAFREQCPDEVWGQKVAEWQNELDVAAAKRAPQPEKPLAPVVAHPSARPKVSKDVPPIYEGCTFETWRGDVGFDVSGLREWAGVPSFVLVLGPQGVGKSHLGVAVYREWYGRSSWWMRFGEMPRWTTADAYVQRLKAEFGTDYEAVEKRMTGAALLVLDDLGQERSTEWSTDSLARLLMARWMEKRPTLVTSNLDMDGLKKWEPRIASRLFGHDGLVVDLSALADYRQGGAA